MEGIPGAVGGGLRMNAGAMGAQTFDKVVRVRYLDAEGNAAREAARGARSALSPCSVARKELCGLGGFSRGTPARREEIDRRLEESQEKRRTTQPSAKSAGCIFKNPEHVRPGNWSMNSGLKNSHVGKARVSEVHGNFIVNDGGATAREMLELIEKIKATARDENAGSSWKRKCKSWGRIMTRPARLSSVVGAGLMTKGDLPKKIAVLMGGPGSEREVSLATGAGVSKALTFARHGSDGCRCARRKLRLAARCRSCLHRIARNIRRRRSGPENSRRPRRAYTGEGVEESELAFDKIRSKEKFLEHGVTTPEWEVIPAGRASGHERCPWWSSRRGRARPSASIS